MGNAIENVWSSVAARSPELKDVWFHFMYVGIYVAKSNDFLTFSMVSQYNFRNKIPFPYTEVPKIEDCLYINSNYQAKLDTVHFFHSLTYHEM